MNMGMRGAAASLLILATAAPSVAMAQQPAAKAAPAAAAAAKEKSALNSEREKIGYAVGLDVANSFEPIASEIDLKALRRGVENAFAGGQPLISQEEAQKTDAALRNAVMARNGQQVPGMAPGAAPSVDKEKVGLMLGGYAVGPSLAPLQKDVDLDSLFQAVQTVFSKGQTLMTAQESQATLQAYMTAKQASAGAENRKAGNDFLNANKAKPGVVTTASGLQYQVLRAGSGERPSASSRVRVNYEGKLLDGSVFDSSYARNEPAEFGLNQVIAGWSEGVALMPVGSKYRFWIPSALAYGPNGAPGGKIGPDATLSFDVELLSVLP